MKKYLFLFFSFVSIACAQLAIPWSDVDKTGSSLLDFTTRSAGDLNSGTLASARLPSTISQAQTFSAGISVSGAVYGLSGTTLGSAAANWIGSNSVGGWFLNAPTGQTIGLGINNTTVFGIASAGVTVTGAGTFSGLVTATGNAATTAAFRMENSGGAGGTAQHYANMTAGATPVSRFLRGNGAAGYAANGLNIDNFDGFQVGLNVLGGTGGSFNIRTAGTTDLFTVSSTGAVGATGVTTAATGAVGITSTDPSLRMKTTGSVVADQNTYEIRNVGVTAQTYLQFRTINDANTVFTTRAALWNSGGFFLGGTPMDPGAGNMWVTGTDGFGRIKSTNGSTATPVEDRVAGFVNSNAASVGTGMYALNSYADNSAAWLRFKTTNSAGTSATALTLASDGSATVVGSATLGGSLTLASSTFGAQSGTPAIGNNLTFTSNWQSMATGVSSLFAINDGGNGLAFYTSPSTSGGTLVTLTKQFAVTTTATTVSGNLVVSGTGTSTFAGSMTVGAGAAQGITINSGSGQNALVMQQAGVNKWIQYLTSGSLAWYNSNLGAPALTIDTTTSAATFAGAAIINGTVSASGSRPVIIEPGTGNVKVRGGAGGWDAVGLRFEGSAGTLGGAIYAEGGTDSVGSMYWGYGSTPSSAKRIIVHAGGTSIQGTNTNDNASTGYIGEYVSSTVASGSGAALTTTDTAYNVTSISLTAGDWDVAAISGYNMSGTTVTQFVSGISTNSATLPAESQLVAHPSTLTTYTGTFTPPIPRVRISLSGTTTVFLVERLTFSAGTATGYGTMSARRAR